MMLNIATWAARGALYLGLLAVLGVAYYMGYRHASVTVENDYLSIYREAQERANAEWLKERERAEALEQQLTQQRDRVKVVKEQVHVFVKPEQNEYCGPSVGIVGLLNGARRPDLPLATASSDDEGRAPSGLTYTELINSDIDIAERYNELMVRHNALIEWLEQHYGGFRRSD